MIHIDVVNACTILTDEEIHSVIPALQRQINQHFYPEWGVKGNLSFVAKRQKPKKDHWWIVILDHSDVAGVLGYHDLTVMGLPMGKVFAATDKLYGLSWTVTLSHEILEMLVDPNINLSAEGESGVFYAYEICDACEDDSFAYHIDNVLVSDFVTPEWFEDMKHPYGTKFDFKGVISGPLKVVLGGYISALDINNSKGWVQLTNKSVNMGRQYSFRPKVGSRRERRNISKEELLKSVVEVDKS